MDDDLAALRAIPDPLDRARRAHLAIGEAEQIRNDAIAEADRGGGVSQAAIGEHVGMTRARVSQILAGGPGPERAFWGAHEGGLTVALGEKLEACKPGASGEPGPAVAVEDFAGFEELREAAERLGVKASCEMIRPPGFVDLNRPGLVVICGPRLSPLVAQVLASDRSLGFSRDASGWLIDDRRAGETHRSPMDSGKPSDIAYLGRLPRPDGQGTFLYLAGIHAPGAPGAIHWLSGHLAEAWQAVRDRRFSCLIRCTFDPDKSRQILSSERITEFYEAG